MHHQTSGAAACTAATELEHPAPGRCHAARASPTLSTAHQARHIFIFGIHETDQIFEVLSGYCKNSWEHWEQIAHNKGFCTKIATLNTHSAHCNGALHLLYWCGIREGELLALTPADFDFEKRTVSITKSYQRLNGQDLITTPKTEKSNRVIQMPQFLVDEIQDYLKQLYDIQSNNRMFTVTKSYLHHEMDRGAKEANIKRIRIHDLRHSHVSLLIDMGFSATAIADRVGHESIDITYNYAHLFPSKQLEMADKLNLERS